MANNYTHPFNKMRKGWERLKKRLPILASNEAVNEFKDNFTREGFRGDNGVVFWKPRKKKTKGKARAILVKSGRLKRALKAAPIANIARVINDTPYSEVHNEGLTINHPGGTRINHFKTFKSGKNKGKKLFAKAGKAHYGQKNHAKAYTIKMPKRQFMGTSKPLLNNISKIVDNELKQILP
jgi:phage gpG-like protein